MSAMHQRIIEAGGWNDDVEAFGNELYASQQAWTTLDQCEENGRRNSEAFAAFVRAFPDERLNDVITLPFGGGTSHTVAEMMLSHYWNCSYHEGQINYISSLLPSEV